ncbi:Acyl-CoA dehydrogenase, short-chain specific [Bremerella volcania]|uniref:Acyl-CoA dehydrogenase, short-chain specific n=1 Tax=Bremerella volcania TaxID=2527984 RepID=A0A518C3Q0_9BACT|nr:acyl-CoA dehydrogenase family protein [Bremerella volcania]QDU73845.1 Acyl-CoA dehydrogenase, short-chain specific [Bremerella volcania]
MSDKEIITPDSANLAALCAQLSENANSLQTAQDWPAQQLLNCAQHGVFRWFIAQEQGGLGWSGDDVVRGYLELSAACLTTTFVITQRTGACRRIASSENEALKKSLLPDLLSGRTFATVGISHLTTSRQHLKKPALLATEVDGGYKLDGYSPWVTGAKAADTLVIGACLEDGRQMLLAVPAKGIGVEVGEPAELVGLSASQTGPVHFKDAFCPHEWVLDGPREDVMKKGKGANTGGLETSTLAVGLSTAAYRFLVAQREKRSEFAQPTEHFEAELEALKNDLLAAAAGEPQCDPMQIRSRANSLVLRITQAALSSAKGAGYLQSHDVGRWCREALFFLVWSCPSNVLSANLCELARIEG